MKLIQDMEMNYDIETKRWTYSITLGGEEVPMHRFEGDAPTPFMAMMECPRLMEKEHGNLDRVPEESLIVVAQDRMKTIERFINV